MINTGDRPSLSVFELILLVFPGFCLSALLIKGVHMSAQCNETQPDTACLPSSLPLGHETNLLLPGCALLLPALRAKGRYLAGQKIASGFSKGSNGSPMHRRPHPEARSYLSEIRVKSTKGASFH